MNEPPNCDYYTHSNIILLVNTCLCELVLLIIILYYWIQKYGGIRFQCGNCCSNLTFHWRMIQRCVLYVRHLCFTHFIDIFIRMFVNLREVWDNERIIIQINRLLWIEGNYLNRKGFIGKEDEHPFCTVAYCIWDISILYMFSIILAISW